MKILILAVLSFATTLSFAVTAVAAAETYNLDASHSEVGFSVKHLMISNVKGRFNKFEGSFQFDEAKNEISKVNVKIDASSIDTNDKKRDEHLVSDDFLGTAKNQNITFMADKAVKLTNGKAQIPGTLTIRGKSKTVTLETVYTGSGTDPWGNQKVAFTASTTINRRDFGVNWNKTMDKGGVVVADDLKILIEGQANKAGPPAAAAKK